MSGLPVFRLISVAINSIEQPRRECHFGVDSRITHAEGRPIRFLSKYSAIYALGTLVTRSKLHYYWQRNHQIREDTCMSEDKSKRLRVFRFWLIGVFMIILAAYITIGFVFPDSLLLRELNYWLGIIFTAVLFAVWYFGYKFWLGRE